METRVWLVIDYASEKTRLVVAPSGLTAKDIKESLATIFFPDAETRKEWIKEVKVKRLTDSYFVNRTMIL